MHVTHSLRARSFWLVLLYVLFCGTGALHAQRRSPPVLVRRVIDGDSIEVTTIGRVNLLGITVPKAAGHSQSSPRAREAHQRLEGLLTNRWVRLEFETDAARSGAAYVFLDDGRFVNAWMLREGLARVASQSVLRRSRELLAAEAEARSSRRGLWADGRKP